MVVYRRHNDIVRTGIFRLFLLSFDDWVAVCRRFSSLPLLDDMRAASRVLALA